MIPGCHSSAIRRGTVALALATALAGCAGVGDDTGASLLTVSGKYREYTCSDIATSMKTARAREEELAQLMTRSAQGAGGEFVNTIAYRTEYLQARVNQKLLAEAAGNKNCAGQSRWSSERSVF